MPALGPKLLSMTAGGGAEAMTGIWQGRGTPDSLEFVPKGTKVVILGGGGRFETFSQKGGACYSVVEAGPGWNAE